MFFIFLVISLIRLEFNSEDCDYYTELDAVKLVGVTPNSKLNWREGLHEYPMRACGAHILYKLVASQGHTYL